MSDMHDPEIEALISVVQAMDCHKSHYKLSYEGWETGPNRVELETDEYHGAVYRIIAYMRERYLPDGYVEEKRNAD
jgi:hypothetical protein